jgi:hypothetical protein
VELYTLNRNFIRQSAIDIFSSVIWTERYYGDSEVELVVPPTPDMIQKLPVGMFLALKGSREVMILETMNIEKGKLKVTGISLLQWLNNRFIRASAAHADKYWPLPVMTAGQAMSYIVQNMCISGPYLDGSVAIGVPQPIKNLFPIPGLSIKSSDGSGPQVNIAVPFGPVYDALRAIATTYLVGMQITLESASDTGYSLQFRSYKGLDRTTGQTVNPPVRFSPEMDTLTNIKEVQSIANQKTVVFSYAPSNPGGLATVAGAAQIPTSAGFDLRALMTFEEDITTDMIGGSAATLTALLNQRANLALVSHPFAKAVDGEIVPLNQFQYGRDYTLGDIIEVQGNSGVVQTSRVTEYIRAQDDAGERAYPTVAMLG